MRRRTPERIGLRKPRPPAAAFPRRSVVPGALWLFLFLPRFRNHDFLDFREFRRGLGQQGVQFLPPFCEQFFQLLPVFQEERFEFNFVADQGILLQFDLLSIGVLLDRLPGDDAAGGSFQIRSLLILLRSRIRPDGNPPDRDLADGVGADFARVIFQFFPEHPAVGIVRRRSMLPVR